MALDLNTLNANLLAAQIAYHKLMTGAQEVHVQHGDMSTVYTKATQGQLKSYMDDLKGQIQSIGGSVDGLVRRSITVDLK